MKALSIVGTLAMFLVGAGLWYMVLRRCITPLNISPAAKCSGGDDITDCFKSDSWIIIGGIVVLGVKAVAKMRGQAINTRTGYYAKFAIFN